jgi:hypothetical protein
VNVSEEVMQLFARLESVLDSNFDRFVVGRSCSPGARWLCASELRMYFMTVDARVIPSLLSLNCPSPLLLHQHDVWEQHYRLWQDSTTDTDC